MIQEKYQAVKAPTLTENVLDKSLSKTNLNQWRGAAWKVFAFACYAALNGIARYLSGGADSSIVPLPVNVIVFFQDLFALLIILPWIYFLSSKKKLKAPKRVGLHTFRVVISAFAVICWYYALLHLKLIDAIALSIIGPLFGVAGAKIFLREKIGRIKGIILIVCFCVVFMILRPEAAFLANKNNSVGLLFILCSSMFFALAKLATRKLALNGETPQSLTVYLLVFIVPVSFIIALFDWQHPSFSHLPWLFAAGALTVLAIFAVSAALKEAEVTFLAPFDVFRYIFNAAVAYLAFTELPAIWAFWLLGAGVCLSVSTLQRKKA